MKVFILGVGDAFTAVNYNTCFIVQSEDGFNLAVECPHPYLRILHDAKKINNEIPEIKDVNNFIITHLHSDHCSGLETIGFYKKFVDKEDLNLTMTWNNHIQHEQMIIPGMGTSLIDGKIIKTYGFEYFKYNHMGFGRKEPHMSKCGPFIIECNPTEHYVPAQALLITEGNKTLGFSGDTKFDPGLIEWLNKADFILHETGPAPGHTPLENLVALPSEIKRKIRLIHYSDSLITNEFAKSTQAEVIYI
jgi:ribonuclease BN (tRNA processing enzyme)